MIPPTAGGVAFLGRTGKAAYRSEAFRQGRQGRRVGGVLLQQVKASLDHLGLAEAKSLPEAVEPGLAGVIEAQPSKGCNPWGCPGSMDRSLNLSKDVSGVGFGINDKQKIAETV